MRKEKMRRKESTGDERIGDEIREDIREKDEK